MVTPSLLLLSCVNVELDIEFNSDLSGKADVHYWLYTGSLFEGNVDIPLKESKIVERYGSIEGVSLSDVRVESTSGETHCHFILEFEEFNDFLKSDVLHLSKDSYIAKNDEGNYEFLGVIEGEDTPLKFMYGVLSGYTFNITVGMPGRILTTNGEKCGWNKVRWEYNLFELLRTPRTELKATSTSGGIFSLLFTYYGLPLIILALIVVIIIYMLIIIFRRRKRSLIVSDEE